MSAMTGTGGPLVLLPILFFFRVEAIEAIGLAQFIQIPIGTLATASNIALGRLEWHLAASLGVTVVIGAGIGAVIAHRYRTGPLRLATALLLIVAGATYGYSIR